MKNNTKICFDCKQEKTLDNFYVIKTKIDYYCKYCRNGNSIKGQLNNKKKCSLATCDRPHYAKDLCRMHYARKISTGIIEREPTHIDKVYVYKNGKYKYKDYRTNHLLNRYKMTMEEFDKMSANGCWICGGQNIGIRRLHVDHDHKCCGPDISCGKCVRGILCNRCNISVGKYEKNIMRDDNPYKEQIIQYLLNYKVKRSLI